MKRIVLTGGGSGGHITPLYALIDTMKERYPEVAIHYIGEKYDTETLNSFQDLGVTVHGIPAGKFRRYARYRGWRQLLLFRANLQNIRDIFRYFAGIRASKKILTRIQPDILFCKGGHVSLPVGVAAQKCGIPYVVHESDTRMGIANRKLAPKAVAVAVAWPIDTYGNKTERFVQTGIPLRSIKTDSTLAYSHFGLNPDKPIVSILGGSNGSRRLNILTLAIIAELSQHAQVVWLCGKSHVDLLTKELSMSTYNQKNVHLRGYIAEHFLELLTVSSLVVSRAGATSLTELAKLTKPAIIIPSKNLTDQVKNTTVLHERNAVVTFDEDDLLADPSLLLHEILRLLQSPDLLQTLGTSLAHALPNDGSARVLELLVQSTTPTEGA